MMAFSNLPIVDFGSTIAACWGKLPGKDSDWIAGMVFVWTVCWTIGSAIYNVRKRKVIDRIQQNQIELERLSSLHGSLDASRAITDRLLRLNEVQLSHSKISLMEMKESEKRIDEVTGPPEDIMALETLIYMKLNIFEGIATLISGEEKELLASVQKGGFDSNGWGNWVESELKKPLISSVFQKSPSIWSKRLTLLHKKAHGKASDS